MKPPEIKARRQPVKSVTTPGPWRWCGTPDDLQLATVHSGRITVMDFARKGMRGGQPRFQPGKGMENADELLRFQVGDPSIVGEKQAKADASVYRYQISGIACADARLIEASPELLEACKKSLQYFDNFGIEGPVVEETKKLIARIECGQE